MSSKIFCSIQPNCQISGSHRVADKRLMSYKKLHHVNWQLFTADTALASQNIWILTELSLTSLQQTSRTGPCIVCMDLGIVLPVCSTSQHRTWNNTLWDNIWHVCKLLYLILQHIQLYILFFIIKLLIK